MLGAQTAVVFTMWPITPFKILIPEEKLQTLRQKLLLTKLPGEVPLEEPRSRGAPLQEIKSLVDYWLNTFDWRVQENNLNAFPQFKVKVDVDGFGTYKVHFVHQRSHVKNAIPLLFLHGWPGSFIEVTKILPGLVEGGKDFPAFHVVAPSLIDYGFSQGNQKVCNSCFLTTPSPGELNLRQEGFNLDQHAETYHKLMGTLGYSEYGKNGIF